MEKLLEKGDLEATKVALENAQQEINRLKGEIVDKTNTMDEAVLNLEKAATILSHWFGEYEFVDAPQPMAALRYGEETGVIHNAQSAKWILEYRSIVQLINIVNDYVYASKNALKG